MNFMEAALKEAAIAAQEGEVPIGAVITYQGQIIARAHNETQQRPDPTAHAEILALQRAASHLQVWILDQCDLYVTLEPCAMCAQALSIARLRRVYFGAYDLKGGAIDHGPRLYQQTSCFHVPEVYGGLKEKECATLLKDFFLALRTTSKKGYKEIE